MGLAGGLLWIPPGPATLALPWDDLATGEQVVSAYGSTYASARAETTDRVSAYLEEIDELARAGASLDSRAWCERSESDRRRLLSDYGINGRFTR